MKTINKKHILAGLLMVAAMAPGKTACFSPTLKTQSLHGWISAIFMATLATFGLYHLASADTINTEPCYTQSLVNTLNCKENPDAIIQVAGIFPSEKTVRRDCNGNDKAIIDVRHLGPAILGAFKCTCTEQKNCTKKNSGKQCPFLVKLENSWNSDPVKE